MQEPANLRLLRGLATHSLLQHAELLVAKGCLRADVVRLMPEGMPRSGDMQARWVQRETETLQVLEAAGVPLLILKGALLSRTEYADPRRRFRTDTDILVPAAALFDAERALYSLGYRREQAEDVAAGIREAAWSWRKDEILHVVDLHWALTSHPITRDILTFETLRQSARPVPLAGVVGRGLSRGHALLHACLHWHSHQRGEFKPLLWVLDVDRLWQAMGDSEREWCVAEARNKRISCLLHDLLAQADALFATAVDSGVLESLRIAGVDEDCRRLLTPGHSPWREFMLALRGEPGWRGRWAYAKQLLYPPEGHLRSKFAGSDAPRWALALRRLWRASKR